MIGDIIYFAGNIIPNGWMLCDGRELDRQQYKALYKAIGITWGAGNGYSTFNIPNFLNRFLEGTVDTPGQYKAAGLPNITGSITQNNAENYTAGDWDVSAQTGALRSSARAQTKQHLRAVSYSAGTSCFKTITFNAKNSNAIYGNSTTVQPFAKTLLVLIGYE